MIFKNDIDFIDYQYSLSFMKEYVKDIYEQKRDDLIWSLFHNHLYTKGVSAKDSELLNKNIKIYNIDRGGKFTYHGPGIRIIYIMVDIKRLFNNKPDIRKFIQLIENIIIKILREYNIDCHIKKDYIGVWAGDKKIAAIGFKIKKWVSYHGIAININPDLSYFNNIIPCGISNLGVTSLYKESGINIDIAEFDNIVEKSFQTEML